MVADMPVESEHFTLELLADGVYGCMERPGGGAFSNAGIIDLGDRTLVVDVFSTIAAGRDLRRTAEALFDRPVHAAVLTHPHSDHWIGASALDPHTTLLTGNAIRQVCLEWGTEIVAEFQDPAGLEAALREVEVQLQGEPDERARAGLEKAIRGMRYAVAESAEFQPRYADLTFTGDLVFEGSERRAEVRSMGRGHSEEDVVVLLPDDGVAFIGDIGFFACQPFLGYCDLDLYRDQLYSFRRSNWQVLVPGHGPLGNRDDIALELAYLDVMEERVGEVVKRGGSLDEAMAILLPDPFDGWLMGGLRRFEANVRYLFAHLGGEVPDQPA